MSDLVEVLEVRVSICVECHANTSWTAYPQWADHLRFTGESREEAIRRVLSATANSFEEEA